MLDDIYNLKILEYAGNIPHLGKLEEPQASAKAHSRLCGSTVMVEISMKDQVVTQFAQDVKACALGQASAAILGQSVIGATADELRLAHKQLYSMLKEGGSVPTGRFSELSFLEPVKEYRARHASTLLAFDAVVDAIDTLEKDKSQPSEDGN
ncbi:iron-sulfur cluster assembly scaffold protein [Flexibacterium corallicola]|uniref:iron-sulfur cluster assembly scaffold protein n=1 Tax=Flexibacterium corallicola TaxID=3037259 RepID=UPI00286EBA6B|nr:iron-sulfur cluster assembly scaffold protein [Pseudovibrio sp. M1P-2-3]